MRREIQVAIESLGGIAAIKEMDPMAFGRALTLHFQIVFIDVTNKQDYEQIAGVLRKAGINTQEELIQAVDRFGILVTSKESSQELPPWRQWIDVLRKTGTYILINPTFPGYHQRYLTILHECVEYLVADAAGVDMDLWVIFGHNNVFVLEQEIDFAYQFGEGLLEETVRLYRDHVQRCPDHEWVSFGLSGEKYREFLRLAEEFVCSASSPTQLTRGIYEIRPGLFAVSPLFLVSLNICKMAAVRTMSGSKEIILAWIRENVTKIGVLPGALSAPKIRSGNCGEISGLIVEAAEYIVDIDPMLNRGFGMDFQAFLREGRDALLDALAYVFSNRPCIILGICKPGYPVEESVSNSHAIQCVRTFLNHERLHFILEDYSSADLLESIERVQHYMQGDLKLLSFLMRIIPLYIQDSFWEFWSNLYYSQLFGSDELEPKSLRLKVRGLVAPHSRLVSKIFERIEEQRESFELETEEDLKLLAASECARTMGIQYYEPPADLRPREDFVELLYLLHRNGFIYQGRHCLDAIHHGDYNDELAFRFSSGEPDPMAILVMDEGEFDQVLHAAQDVIADRIRLGILSGMGERYQGDEAKLQALLSRLGIYVSGFSRSSSPLKSGRQAVLSVPHGAHGAHFSGRGTEEASSPASVRPLNNQGKPGALLQLAANRLIVIGDLHGEYDSLKRIFRGIRLRGLRDSLHSGEVQIVLLGDFMAALNPQDTHKIYDYPPRSEARRIYLRDNAESILRMHRRLMALQSQYPQSIHTLGGNNELSIDCDPGRGTQRTTKELERLIIEERGGRSYLEELREYCYGLPLFALVEVGGKRYYLSHGVAYEGISGVSDLINFDWGTDERPLPALSGKDRFREKATLGPVAAAVEAQAVIKRLCRNLEVEQIICGHIHLDGVPGPEHYISKLGVDIDKNYMRPDNRVFRTHDSKLVVVNSFGHNPAYLDISSSPINDAEGSSSPAEVFSQGTTQRASSPTAQAIIAESIASIEKTHYTLSETIDFRVLIEAIRAEYRVIHSLVGRRRLTPTIVDYITNPLECRGIDQTLRVYAKQDSGKIFINEEERGAIDRDGHISMLMRYFFFGELYKNAHDRDPKETIGVALAELTPEVFMLSVENKGGLKVETLEKLAEELKARAAKGELWQDTLTDELVTLIPRDHQHHYQLIVNRSPRLQHVEVAQANKVIERFIEDNGIESMMLIEGLSLLGGRGLGLTHIHRAIRAFFGGSLIFDTSNPDRTVVSLTFRANRVCTSSPVESLRDKIARFPAIYQPNEVMAIWPVGRKLVNLLGPLRRLDFQDLLLMNSFPQGDADRIDLQVLELLEQDVLNPNTGYLITAAGQSSLDLLSLSGRSIDDVQCIQRIPGEPGACHHAWRINTNPNFTMVLIKQDEEQRVVVEIPKRYSNDLSDIIFGRQSIHKGTIGIWFIDRNRVDDLKHLPIVTFENSRDFAATFADFLFGTIRHDSPAVLRGEIETARQLAQIAARHGKRFLLRLDLHDFSGLGESVDFTLTREDIIVELEHHGFEAILLEDEDRTRIDPSASEEAGPSIYAAVSGSSSPLSVGSRLVVAVMGQEDRGFWGFIADNWFLTICLVVGSVWLAILIYVLFLMPYAPFSREERAKRKKDREIDRRVPELLPDVLRKILAGEEGGLLPGEGWELSKAVIFTMASFLSDTRQIAKELKIPLTKREEIIAILKYLEQQEERARHLSEIMEEEFGHLRHEEDGVVGDWYEQVAHRVVREGWDLDMDNLPSWLEGYTPEQEECIRENLANFVENERRGSSPVSVNPHPNLLDAVRYANDGTLRPDADYPERILQSLFILIPGFMGRR
ncbi:metallophosphoesterase [Thermoproteota archaeon]